jgi:hypothetical protein
MSTEYALWMATQLISTNYYVVQSIIINSLDRYPPLSTRARYLISDRAIVEPLSTNYVLVCNYAKSNSVIVE